MEQRIPVIINDEIHYSFQWSNPHPELSSTSVSTALLVTNNSGSSLPLPAMYFTSVSTAQLVASVTPVSPRELQIPPEYQAEVDAVLFDVSMEDEDDVANWAQQVSVRSIGSLKYTAIHLLQTK